MPTLAEQLHNKAATYVAHGGKQHRRQQLRRLAIFLRWVQENFQVNELNQIGKRQVIAFWKSHRDIAPRTAIRYWSAIAQLWNWLERSSPPPRPWVTPPEATGAA